MKSVQLQKKFGTEAQICFTLYMIWSYKHTKKQHFASWMQVVKYIAHSGVCLSSNRTSAICAV